MKYFKKKIIKGKEYYYFEYYLGLDEKKTFTRYIGAEIPPHVKEPMKQYFQEIAALVSRNISNSYFRRENIETIEKARFKYILLNHELFEPEKKLLKTLFYILFVLNSNRSEGSDVTREDIEKIMAKKIKPKTTLDKEIINSIEAINFAFSDKMRWNPKTIRKLHSLLFWNIYPDFAGQYKKVNNIVGNSPTTTWKEVPPEMRNLLQWFHRHKKKMYPPQLALEFHWRFESIHPFQDGNGRVGRILLNAFLIEQGYAPVIYFTDNHRAYCRSLSAARESYSPPLAKHYSESITKSEKAIGQYQKEGIIAGGSSQIGKWEIQKGKIRVGR